MSARIVDVSPSPPPDDRDPRADQAMVEGVHRGDMLAAAAFYARYHRRVFRWVWRTLRVQADAEDMVQAIFEQLFSQIHTVRKIESLDEWVSAVTYRMLCKELRYRRVRRVMHLEPDCDTMMSAGMRPDEAQVLLRVDAVLHTMPSQEHMLFVLRYVEGATVTEMARISGMSESTVKRRLGKAIRRFRTAARRDPVLADFMERVSDDAS